MRLLFLFFHNINKFDKSIYNRNPILKQSLFYLLKRRYLTYCRWYSFNQQQIYQTTSFLCFSTNQSIELSMKERNYQTIKRWNHLNLLQKNDYFSTKQYQESFSTKEYHKSKRYWNIGRCNNKLNQSFCNFSIFFCIINLNFD